MTTRRLSYELSRSYIQENETPEEGVFNIENWPTEEENQQVSLTITLSLAEYVQIASCVDVGRDIAYPDDSIYMWWLWTRIISNMTICEDVANCIETSGAVQEALGAFVQSELSGTTGTQPQPMSPAQTAANLLPSGYTCDSEHLCGMSRWVVSNLHDGTLQLLQQLELATNLWELVTVFVDNVEVVSWFGSAAELALWLQEQLIEYYELAWSTTVEDEMTCRIFCKIEPSCELTLDKLLEAYEEAFEASFTPPDINDVIAIFNWLAGLDYETASSIAIVSSFHWFVLQALRFASPALNFTAGMRSLKQMVATGSDETDTYCDIEPCDCVETENWYIWDFTVNDGGWVNRPDLPNRGEYISGVGWVSESADGFHSVYIVNLGMENVVIDKVQLQGSNYTTPDFTMSIKQIVMRDNYASSSGQILPFNTTGGNASDVCSDGSDGSFPAERVTLGANYHTGNAANRFVIEKIAIRIVSGTPPSGGSAATAGIC